MANMYPIWSPRDGAELRSLAIFRAHGWAYVVATTPERGPDGKFVKRGRR